MICDNWEMTKARFEAWWNNSSIDRPLLRIVAKRDTPLAPMLEGIPAKDVEDGYTNAERLFPYLENALASDRFMADAYPEVSLNFGPGSLAIYLGSKPVFTPQTVWFTPFLKSPTDPFRDFDENEYWFAKHLAAYQKLKAHSRGRYIVNIPDIIENIDIYAAMRGPQETCFDIMDEPEALEQAIEKINSFYFPCYDKFYEVTKTDDGISGFTAFDIIGKGKTAKVQCDFSALMSPDQFRHFVMPGLREQCRKLSHSVYHVDGPDALRHVEALNEIKELQAIQWSHGDGHPGNMSPVWFDFYDEVKKGGKAIMLFADAGDFDANLRAVDRLVDRYGIDGMYFKFPYMTEKQGEELLDYAEKHWHK